MSYFIRRQRFTHNAMKAATFGPWPEEEGAQNALRDWSERTGIPLNSGMPFPTVSYWTECGTMFWIERGMGRGKSLEVD